MPRLTLLSSGQTEAKMKLSLCTLPPPPHHRPSGRCPGPLHEDDDDELFDPERPTEEAHKNVEKHDAGLQNTSAVPSGGRIGLTGFDIAKSSLGKCACCLHAGLADDACKVLAGEYRFMFRIYPNKPDRSVHVKCVESGAILKLPSASHS